MLKRCNVLVLLLLLATLPLNAQIWESGKGFSLYSSAVKFAGDTPDRAALGVVSGVGLRYAPSMYLQFEASAGYGGFKPAIEGSRYKKNSADPYRTFLFPLTLGVRLTPVARGRLKPYIALGAGVLYWDLRFIEDDEQRSFWSDNLLRWGQRVSGLRKNALLYQGVGIEWFITPSFSLDLQGRFSALLQMRTDNVGYDDVNNQVLQGIAQLTWYWGYLRDRDRDGMLDKFDADPERPEDFDGFQDGDGAPEPDNDLDGVPDVCDLAPLQSEDKDGWLDGDGLPDPDNDEDGIPDEQDLCPNEPEDLDGFEDNDGCPDIDNDQDGIVDALDACPNEAEDMDGWEDSNGCPDFDNDGDLIVDAIDKCPDQAETINGYLDEDGCPDADSDGDGVPDERDRCPGAAETMNGFEDDDGCPDELQLKPQEESGPAETPLVLQGVTFASGKAELTPESLPVLDEVANGLVLNDQTVVEIRGHTDNIGDATVNQILSEKRAEAVRQYLLSKGIAPERVTAVGFGARFPVASNKTSAGRAQNRRIEFVRVK